MEGQRGTLCVILYTTGLEFDENWWNSAPHRCIVTFGVAHRSIMGHNEVTYVTLICQHDMYIHVHVEIRCDEGRDALLFCL